MKKSQKNNLAATQPQQENSQPITKPYKVFDSDIVVNDKEIADYYWTSMKMLVMRFQLVGSFNRNGQYIIKDEIRYDLVKMRKEISDSGEDFYKAVVIYMKKYFYFDVKISMIDDKRAKASLFLSEFVDDALQDGYIVSHIADFIDEFDEQFRIKVRQAFNLADVALINEDYYIPNLAILMQDEYDINKYVGNLYDIASQIYIMRMLKLLEGAGPLGQEIIKRYKELIIDKEEEYKDDKFKYSRFKYLLDRAINEKGGLEKLPLPKEKIRDIVVEVNKSVRAIDSLQSRAGAVEIMTPQNKSGKSPTEEAIFGKSAGGKSKSNQKNAPPKGKTGKSKSKSSDDSKSKKSGGVYVDLSHPQAASTPQRHEPDSAPETYIDIHPNITAPPPPTPEIDELIPDAPISPELPHEMEQKDDDDALDIAATSSFSIEDASEEAERTSEYDEESSRQEEKADETPEEKEPEQDLEVSADDIELSGDEELEPNI